MRVWHGPGHGAGRLVMVMAGVLALAACGKSGGKGK